MDLIELTTDLGVTHTLKAESEKELKKLREDFFNEATKESKKKTLARKTSTLALAVEEKEARSIFSAHYPGWIVKEVKKHDKAWQAVIEEDPEFADFVFINPKDEKKYRRQRVEGGMMLDDELMRKHDPELWDEITEWPNREFLEDLLYQANMELEDIPAHIDTFATNYGLRKVLVDPETWQPSITKRAEPFWYQGAPTLKLAAPTKAKPEELSGSDD